jgi:hypothetical protein
MLGSLASAALALALVCAGAGKRDDDDDTRKRRRPAARAPRVTAPIEVPIDVGVGVIGLVPNPPAFSDQPVFTGLTLSVEAVVDKELIQKNRHRIPPQWRAAARNVNELRIRPWWLGLIPETLVISPAIFNTGMYGAIWRPLGAGVTLIDSPVRLSVGAALDVAYLFIHSKTLPPGGVVPGTQSFTHFLRPGLNATAQLEVPITERFLVSTGWASDFFVPQPIGGAPWELFPLEDSLWHLGGPFLALHFRFPYAIGP